MGERKIYRIVKGVETSDGAGVNLVRSLGSKELDMLDPFLLLDEFKSDDPSDYIAGFPKHPHRGFETVTYLIAGVVEHGDSHGHSGFLKGGGVQWMTAGRGIVHSEMPRQENGLLWGFQLWVNLPASEKMRPPRYRNIEPNEVPEISRPDGTKIRVIAGEAEGVKGAVQGVVTEPLYLDVKLPPGVSYSHDVPEDHSVFAYLFEGDVIAGKKDVVASTLIAFEDKGNSVTIKAGSEGARFLLIAAKRLGEPVTRYGPFVMNTKAEIAAAFDDYRAGKFQG